MGLRLGQTAASEIEPGETGMKALAMARRSVASGIGPEEIGREAAARRLQLVGLRLGQTVASGIGSEEAGMGVSAAMLLLAGLRAVGLEHPAGMEALVGIRLGWVAVVMGTGALAARARPAGYIAADTHAYSGATAGVGTMAKPVKSS